MINRINVDPKSGCNNKKKQDKEHKIKGTRNIVTL
jgi:hypothetical protein